MSVRTSVETPDAAALADRLREVQRRLHANAPRGVATIVSVEQVGERVRVAMSTPASATALVAPLPRSRVVAIVEVVAESLASLEDEGHGRLTRAALRVDEAGAVVVDGAIVDAVFAEVANEAPSPPDAEMLVRIAAELLAPDDKAIATLRARATVTELGEAVRVCREVLAPAPFAGLLDPGDLVAAASHGDVLRPATVPLGERIEEPDLARSVVTDPRLGAYELEAFLGSGAYAEVYGATHAVRGDRAAVKLLKAELAGSERVRRRFLREAEVLERVDHPNVMRTLGTGSTPDGRPYVLLEWLDGPSLREIVKASAPLSLTRVCRLGAQIAAGLRALHAAGYVHRDLKPENLIVVGGPEDERLAIADLGFARFPIESEKTRLTGQGERLGTPAFMAPEQVLGHEVGPAADIYAFGVTLFVMSTGRVPYAGTVEEVFERHLGAPIPEDGSLGPLASIVTAMMAKRAEARPSLDAIERVLAGLLDAPTASALRSPTMRAPSRAEDLETTALVRPVPVDVRYERSRGRRVAVVGAIALAGGLAWAWSASSSARVEPELVPVAAPKAPTPFVETRASPFVEARAAPEPVEPEVARTPRVARRRVRAEPERRVDADDRMKRARKVALERLRAVGVRRADVARMAGGGQAAPARWVRAEGGGDPAALEEATTELLAVVEDPEVANAIVDARLDGVLAKLQALGDRGAVDIGPFEREYFALRKRRLGADAGRDLRVAADRLDRRVRASVEASR